MYRVRRTHRRSIPACAGEPVILPTVGCHRQVYPRVCGGTAQRAIRRSIKLGLSPRVRGNQPARLRNLSVRGSIPACAGEPRPGSALSSQAAVYPRVCGGTASPSTCTSTTSGLSPRVRGNQGGRGRSLGMLRSIPACAGEPCPDDAPRLSLEVYPRVCGGTNDLRKHMLSTEGLSPRVRGNRLKSGESVSGLSPRVRGNPELETGHGD